MHEQRCEVRTASALLAQHRVRLRTGCERIDQCLGGGILARGITEIAGESSAGKTQLGLQLVFQVQLPILHGGLQGGALFLHTEGGEPPMKRLRQIGSAFATKWASLGATCERLCEHVFVEKIETADMLVNTLRYRVPALLSEHRVRLVVIDSIAALFRTHLEGDLPQRSELLVHLAASMKKLSEEKHVVFVVMNQVTDSFAAPGLAATGCARPSLCKRAALGLTWAQCVNARIMLSRSSRRLAPPSPLGLRPLPNTLGAAQPDASAPLHTSLPSSGLRSLRVVSSPCAAEGTCEYVIDASGIQDAPLDMAEPRPSTADAIAIR